MEKPTPKREVAIIGKSTSVRAIYFHSTQDAVTEFQDFGKIYDEDHSQYALYVDSRFDFDEVLAFIEGYG